MCVYVYVYVYVYACACVWDIPPVYDRNADSNVSHIDNQHLVTMGKYTHTHTLAHT